MYFGQPKNLKSHLKEFEIRCPESNNPADIAIDYAAISTRMTKEDLIQNKLLDKLANDKRKTKNNKFKLNDLEAASLDKDDDFEEDNELAMCKIDGKRCIVKHFRENCTQRMNNSDQCCNNYCCCQCCVPKTDRIQFPNSEHTEFYIGKTPLHQSPSVPSSQDRTQMIVNIDQTNSAFGESRTSNNLINFDNSESFFNQQLNSNNNHLSTNRYSANSTYDALRSFKLNQYAAERSASSKHMSVLSNNSTISSQESKRQTVRMIEKAMEDSCKNQVAQVKTQVKGNGTFRLREIQKLCENRNSFSFMHTFSLFKRTFTNSILREPKWIMIRIGLHCLGIGIFYNNKYLGSIILSF